MDKIDSIEDMFYYFCKNKDNALIYKNHFVRNNGQGLVILLDGLDENVEAIQKETFLYTTLIEPNIFSKACIIITSRPHATAELLMYASYRVEIIGFTDIIRRHFLQENLTKEIAEDLETYLQDHPTIDTLCYIPLNMCILVFLFREKNRLQENTLYLILKLN